MYITKNIQPLFICSFVGLIACNSAPIKESSSISAPNAAADIRLVKHVMTKAQQDSLTPDEVLQKFIEGNTRFNLGKTTHRDHSEQVRKSADGQFPKAVILSCLDSRVPVEDVFDQGIGDVFVGRVAGNIVNEDLLGSMEYACKVAGAKLILVMGHQHCRAIKSAIDNVKLGNTTAMLAKIKPAVANRQYYT